MDLPQEPEELLRADVVGDLRLVFGSWLPRVGIALGALLEDGVLLRTSSSDLRFPRGRATFARLVCTSLGLVAATGGLAVAGALPRPVQHAVSDAADTIGFELPDSGFELPFGAPPATTAATPTTPEAARDRGGADGRSLEIPGFGPVPMDAGTVTTTTVAAPPGPAGMTSTPTTAAGKPHITIGGVWTGVPSVTQPTPTTEPSSPPATPPSASSSSTTTSSTTSSTVVPDDGTTTTTPETTPIAPEADLPEP